MERERPTCIVSNSIARVGCFSHDTITGINTPTIAAVTNSNSATTLTAVTCSLDAKAR